MIGGIYCEIPVGILFKDTKRYARRTKLNKLFGVKMDIFRPEAVNDFIINGGYDANGNKVDGLYQIVQRKLGRIMSSAKVPANKGYYNRTVDLMRSTCAGVYHNGELKRMYRFTGGHSELGAVTASDMGTSPSSKSVARMSWLGRTKHPDPAQRAQMFLDGYKLKEPVGFTVVIASTMPYAVRLEYEYRRSVLKALYPRFVAMLTDFKPQNIHYGYVFEMAA